MDSVFLFRGTQLILTPALSGLNVIQIYNYIILLTNEAENLFLVSH